MGLDITVSRYDVGKCPIPGASQPVLKACSTCRWWEEYDAVCFNGDSPFCADFVDDGCDKWEEKDHATD